MCSLVQETGVSVAVKQGNELMSRESTTFSAIDLNGAMLAEEGHFFKSRHTQRRFSPSPWNYVTILALICATQGEGVLPEQAGTLFFSPVFLKHPLRFVLTTTLSHS